MFVSSALTPKMVVSGGVAAEEVSSAIGRYGPYLYQEHVQSIETPFRIGDFFTKTQSEADDFRGICGVSLDRITTSRQRLGPANPTSTETPGS